MMRHALEALEARLLLATSAGIPDLVDRGQEVEPNDTIESATPLAHFPLEMPCRLDETGVIFCPPDVYHGGGTIGGAAATASDIDYFSFEVPAAGRIALNVEGPAIQRGTVVELVNADGTA